MWLAVNHGQVPVNVTVRLRVDDAGIVVRHHTATHTTRGWHKLHAHVRQVEVSRMVPALGGVAVQL
jgi:hypothetical protein